MNTRTLNKPSDLGFNEQRFPEWRAFQRELIEQVHNSDKPNIIIEAPPGFGKSLFAASLANMIEGRTHYLVTTKSLQEQISNEFEHIFSMWGRNMHKCALPGFSDFTVDGAPCTVGFDCDLKKTVCPYYLALAQAQQSRVMVSNYSWYWHNDRHSRGFMTPPELLICDEADSIESDIMRFGSLTITQMELFTLGLGLPVLSHLEEWAEDALETINGEIGTLTEEWGERFGNVSPLEIDSLKSRARITSLEELRGKVETIKNGWTKYRPLYVVDSGTNEFTIRPIVATIDSPDLVMKHGTKRVFMSATIMGKAGFCRDLGIDPNEADFIQVDSPFPAENRPLILHNRARVNNKTLPSLLPDIVDWVDSLIEAYEGKKGIVHTTNYRIAQHILKNSVYRDIMIGHNSTNRQTAIKHFKHKSALAVIVSPSLVRGEDFPGHHCEWQAIVKAPYPNIGDSQVQGRMKVDSQWLDRVALRSLVQAYGRGTRRDTDVCDTHVYDSGIDLLLYRAKDIVPHYIWDAVSRKSTN